MKNIIIFNQNMVIGGVEKVLLNLIKNLDKTKFKIKLILTYSEGELLKEIPKNIEVIYLLDKNFNKNKISFFKGFKYCFELMIMKIKLKKIIKKTDIILNMNARNIKLNYSLLKFKNKKIGWIHGNILNDYGTFREKLNYRLLNQYDLIYNVSKEGKKDFDDKFINLKEKSKYLYNSFDIENIVKKSNEELNIKEKYLLSVGRLTMYDKGYDILIDSIKLLKKEGINKKLFLLGEGPDREKIQNKINSLNLETNIKIIGFDNNPYKWMKNAETFILSSRGEGLPTVLIEALACEVPIISTNCKCGPSEILKDNMYGLLVPTENSIALKEGIKTMMYDKKLVEKLKKQSLNRALDFSNKKIIKNLENDILILTEL